MTTKFNMMFYYKWEAEEFFSEFRPAARLKVEEPRPVRRHGGGGNGNGGGGTFTVYLIAVALGSAGALTALARIISAFLSRHKDRWLIIELDKKRLTIKGHAKRDEESIVRRLEKLIAPDKATKIAGNPKPRNKT